MSPIELESSPSAYGCLRSADGQLYLHRLVVHVRLYLGCSSGARRPEAVNRCSIENRVQTQAGAFQRPLNERMILATLHGFEDSAAKWCPPHLPP